MNNALTISIIGGSMVFIGLILLWVMMDVLVRLTSREKAPKSSASAEIVEDVPAQAGSPLKQQAAAAAVAVALAHANSSASGRAAGKPGGEERAQSLAELPPHSPNQPNKRAAAQEE